MARSLTVPARASASGLALLLACCHAPLTQVVVVVESDLPAGEIAVVRIEVGEDAAPRTSEVRVPADAALPFSFGVHATEGRHEELVEVRLVARDATEAVVAQARARLPFVRGETRRAIVRLERACVGREPACAAEGRTCRAGACVEPEISRDELAPTTPGDELLELPPFPEVDAGPPTGDAGPSCTPACAPDETCTASGCRCGVGVACGAGSLCDEGACMPWPRSCDDVGRARGCDVVELPGGELTMGDEDAFAEFATGAFPVQPSISVAALGLDAYEVTVARFRRFWEAGHPAPSGPVVYPRGRTVEPGPVIEPRPVTEDPTCNWSAAPDAREQHPLNCVPFATALAFCVWDGGRLPTEAEWEWAARGHALGGLTPGRDFPWGAQSPARDPKGMCARAQLFECPGEDGASTRAVGSFAGVVGIHDQIGNVFEWTADHYDLYAAGDGACWNGLPQLDPLCSISSPPNGHTVRGASWLTESESFTYSAARVAVDADDFASGVGFRCAR